jgi:tartrate-resistant acid phosphatase type 5
MDNISKIVALILFLITSQSHAQRFAVFGDYGYNGTPEAQVATLVKKFDPDFIVTTGDNNYPLGAASTIDINIGKYYAQFISNYQGSYGSPNNPRRFLPSLGNHDWSTPGAQPYLNYFSLPGNERYYDTLINNVHVFIVDSDPNEPDGVDSNSVQAMWLKTQLENSNGEWKIIAFHHPPYCSDLNHGNQAWMQWPFKRWGADVVFAGHSHVYERVLTDDLNYVVTGLGGRSIYGFGTPVPGSLVRYNAKYGSVIADATKEQLTVKFFNTDSTLIDQFTLSHTGIEQDSQKNVFLYSPQRVTGTDVFNVKYVIPEAGTVTMELYTVKGELIKSNTTSERSGAHICQMDLSGVSSSVYMCRLVYGVTTLSQKLVFVRN